MHKTGCGVSLASVIHKHPAALSTLDLDLYQFAIGWSITPPFASSRARCGDSLSR